MSKRKRVRRRSRSRIYSRVRKASSTPTTPSASLLHAARPVLLNLGEPRAFDIPPWADRVQLVDAKCVGPRELPALGPVTAPTVVLVRPDGYVARVGDLTQPGLADALTTRFGPPTVA